MKPQRLPSPPFLENHTPTAPTFAYHGAAVIVMKMLCKWYGRSPALMLIKLCYAVKAVCHRGPCESDRSLVTPSGIHQRSLMGGTLSLVAEFTPKGVTYRSTATVYKVCKDTIAFIFWFKCERRSVSPSLTFRWWNFNNFLPPCTCKQYKSTEESNRHHLYINWCSCVPQRRGRTIYRNYILAAPYVHNVGNSVGKGDTNTPSALLHDILLCLKFQAEMGPEQNGAISLSEAVSTLITESFSVVPMLTGMQMISFVWFLSAPVCCSAPSCLTFVQYHQLHIFSCFPPSHVKATGH